MRAILIKTVLVAVAVAGGLFALAGTASASHVKVEIAAPNEATVGNAVTVQASLRSGDEGLPLANTPVAFYTEASFAGVSGEVELGTAVTDENGVAILRYEPRSAGEHQIRVEYLTPGEAEPETATASVISVAGTSQLHRSTSGVQVPGLNVWLIIALVTAVWSILFSVGIRVVAIARAGSDETTLEQVPAPTEAERLATSTARVSTTKA
jgi:hypothetical protein